MWEIGTDVSSLNLLSYFDFVSTYGKLQKRKVSKEQRPFRGTTMQIFNLFVNSVVAVPRESVITTILSRLLLRKSNHTAPPLNPFKSSNQLRYHRPMAAWNCKSN